MQIFIKKIFFSCGRFFLTSFLCILQIRRLKNSQTPQHQQSISFLRQQPRQDFQTEQLDKRIFVARAGTERFVIVRLSGNNDDSWNNFLKDIRKSLGLPRGSHLRLTLANLGAEVLAPSELQSNDKVLVHIL